MGNEWEHSDCLTTEGFPSLLWETLQRVGYTKPLMYYGREYEEDGTPKCEIRVRIPEHPSCPAFKTRDLIVYVRELHDC
jgi:hypothetical protein